MKAFITLILVSIILSVSIIASPVSPARADDEPSVGVKEGDWMEYDVNITGTPPTVHKDVVWMRIEVMQVEDTARSP